MTVIVTDTGFVPDDWVDPFLTPEALEAGAGAENVALDLPSDFDPGRIAAERLTGIDMIRVDFPAFSDGRGFTIARLLRLKGYQGRLRARGHVIPDQYAMARRAGFDEIEISSDLSVRHPESHWMARAAWRAHDYQSRLRVG